MSKNKVGRPPKYTDEYPKKVEKYVDEDYQKDEVIPTMEGVALYLKLALSTVYKWEEEEGKEKFSKALKKLRQKQAKILISKGLDSTFNSVITKLMMHNHGYSDKSQTDVTTQGEKITALSEDDRAILDRFTKQTQNTDKS